MEKIGIKGNFKSRKENISPTLFRCFIMRNNQINNPEQVIDELKKEIDRLVEENIELKLEIQVNGNAAKKAHELISQLKEKDELMNESMENLKISKREYERLIEENKTINEEIKDIKSQIEKTSEELSLMLERSKQFFN